MNQPEINLQYTTIKSPLPDFIYEGLREFSKNANGYKSQPPELISRLAKKHGISEDSIFLTAGADEAIQLFAHAYGQNTFVFTPTYTVYRDVEEFNGTLTRIFSLEGSNYCIPTDTIIGASLIYLANPNNPTGYTETDRVMSLVRNNPEAVVVIDEAYGEFADLSVIPEVAQNPNMAVIRSFSKAYGMAGNRVGYIVANPQIIAVLKNKTQWCNVSYLSVGAALTALDHEEYFSIMREQMVKERELFMAFLVGRGYLVFPSKINAVLVKFSAEPQAIAFVERLRSNFIRVSPGNGSSNIGLDNTFVRIAIGLPEQMQTVKNIISTF